MLYFNESLRGLSVGAPVTLFGLQVGEVTDVGLDLDPATLNLRGRVEIVTFPRAPHRALERTSKRPPAKPSSGASSSATPSSSALVEKRGLRAQLRSGSLLTGQLYVAFDYFPNAPKAKIDWSQDPPELPVVPSTVPDIEAKLGSILTKLDKLPLDAIGGDLRKALATLDQTLKDASKAVNRVDTE